MHWKLFGLMILTLTGTCQAGETLYNGIVLPEQWPPKPATWPREAPITPPYLASPPKVIPIDVGRQLFVDEFLIEKTDLKRTYHLAEYYRGNPVLRPETPGIELRRSSPFAMVFSDGVWWDPSDAIFKMWCLELRECPVRWGRVPRGGGPAPFLLQWPRGSQHAGQHGTQRGRIDRPRLSAPGRVRLDGRGRGRGDPHHPAGDLQIPSQERQALRLLG